ncbi:MAG: arginine repressor [Phycisphaerales bacterium]|nr:arginine repressor [Phycisphaerae bacterium]NNF41952.1 arginine repressor [Phycisphaerales bacterium]NNM27459.1 arginine repressor [Phycisphaerales bacterium]
MPSRHQRHQRIVELLDHHRVRSQQEMQGLLARDGIEATQATLSRDFRELGVSKGPEGYSIPPMGGASNGVLRTLERTVRQELLVLDAAGHTIVIRTRPGHANALAFELDRAQWPEVLGTIAGDDTIFALAPSPRQAQAVVTRLSRMAELADA